jgi:LacI family transcriptional regulator
MPPEDTHPAVTQRDVANALGLSDATVSRALRNSPKIPKARRMEIQTMANRMGYRPNAMASALAHLRLSKSVTQRQAALAWINCWHDPEQLRSYPYHDACWRGAAASAEKFGYYLEQFDVSHELPLTRLETILATRNVRGLLLPPLENRRPPAGWERFHWNRFSVVRFGDSFTELDVNVVKANRLTNDILAFKMIHEKGYQRIGLVTERHDKWITGAGFLWAQLGLPERLRLPPLFFPGNQFREHQADLERWLKKVKPDAIYTDNPHLPEMLKMAGYRVPDDIGVAAMTIPDCHPITAGIKGHAEEMGRVASLVLVSLINDNDKGIPAIPREILVKGEWIDGTTLPARTSR